MSREEINEALRQYFQNGGKIKVFNGSRNSTFGPIQFLPNTAQFTQKCDEEYDEWTDFHGRHNEYADSEQEY